MVDAPEVLAEHIDAKLSAEKGFTFKNDATDAAGKYGSQICAIGERKESWDKKQCTRSLQIRYLHEKWLLYTHNNLIHLVQDVNILECEMSFDKSVEDEIWSAPGGYAVMQRMQCLCIITALYRAINAVSRKHVLFELNKVTVVAKLLTKLRGQRTIRQS